MSRFLGEMYNYNDPHHPLISSCMGFVFCCLANVGNCTPKHAKYVLRNPERHLSLRLPWQWRRVLLKFMEKGSKETEMEKMEIHTVTEDAQVNPTFMKVTLPVTLKVLQSCYHLCLCAVFSMSRISSWLDLFAERKFWIASVCLLFVFFFLFGNFSCS